MIDFPPRPDDIALVFNLGRFGSNFENFGERKKRHILYPVRFNSVVSCEHRMIWMDIDCRQKQSEMTSRALANMLLRVLIFSGFKPFCAFLNDFEVFDPFNFFSRYSLLVTWLLCFSNTAFFLSRRFSH